MRGELAVSGVVLFMVDKHTWFFDSSAPVHTTCSSLRTTMTVMGLFSIDRPSPLAYNHFSGYQIKFPISETRRGIIGLPPENGANRKQTTIENRKPNLTPAKLIQHGTDNRISARITVNDSPTVGALLQSDSREPYRPTCRGNCLR